MRLNRQRLREQRQQVADRTVPFDRVPQRLPGEHSVVISTTDSFTLDKTTGLQFLDNALHRSFGNADTHGDFS